VRERSGDTVLQLRPRAARPSPPSAPTSRACWMPSRSAALLTRTCTAQPISLARTATQGGCRLLTMDLEPPLATAAIMADSWMWLVGPCWVSISSPAHPDQP
jgi:hypothetical protein